jgi:hypothetical protein
MTFRFIKSLYYKGNQNSLNIKWVANRQNKQQGCINPPWGNNYQNNQDESKEIS